LNSTVFAALSYDLQKVPARIVCGSHSAGTARSCYDQTGLMAA